jgi:hypothetical protein
MPSTHLLEQNHSVMWKTSTKLSMQLRYVEPQQRFG